MKRMLVLLFLGLVCIVSLGFMKAVNQYPSQNDTIGNVTANWQYDEKKTQDIVQMRLYYSGGPLICITEDVTAEEMACSIEEVEYQEKFKLTAYNSDGIEMLYPATFNVYLN